MPTSGLSLILQRIALQQCLCLCLMFMFMVNVYAETQLFHLAKAHWQLYVPRGWTLKFYPLSTAYLYVQYACLL
jgi:hypothetical protein